MTPKTDIGLAEELVRTWSIWKAEESGTQPDDEEEGLAAFIDIIETTAAPEPGEGDYDLTSALRLLFIQNEILTRWGLSDYDSETVKIAFERTMNRLAQLVNSAEPGPAPQP